MRTVSPSGQLITTTRTTFGKYQSSLRASILNYDFVVSIEGQSMTNGTMDLTDSALRELERNKQQGANANKSTLIIHSVQRVSLCLVSSFCFFFWQLRVRLEF